MPRSSRHKSSRSHKHGYGKERSDSEDEMISKEKNPRAEEMEKRAAQAAQGKEVIGSGKGVDDVPVEHAKKRKDRTDDSAAGDRWTGGNEHERVVDKKAKGEGFENVELVKTANSSTSGLDSKGRTGRKGEDLTESGDRVESVKRKSEKELSRRESGSSSQYKDEKDRDRDYSKDAKEMARDYVRDVKEHEIEYYKDGKDRDKRLKDADVRDIDQSKDVKDRDYPKDGKERERDRCRDVKERGKEYFKDAKEKGRVYSKDEKERDKDYHKDVKERRRDHPRDAKEFDRDYTEEMKERDRDQSKDAKGRERDYYKDAKEERDDSKCTKEKERDYRNDAKERDRDQGSLQDKNVQDARHEMSNNMGRRKQVSKTSSSREEHVLKKDMEIDDGKLQDNSCNPELEKEVDKRRRGDCFGDVRDSDEKQLSSRDDRTKNGGYKDERHRDGRSRERYRDNLDRDKQHRDERSRDEHFSRDHNSSRSDKHFRDDNRVSESCYKKIKTQDNHHDDSSYVDGHGNNLKHNRAVKRFSDQIDDHIDVKPQSMKESYEDLEIHASSANKFNAHSDRTKLDSMNIDMTDSSLSGNRINHSPGSRNYALKEQKRPSSKQAASSYHKSDEAFHSSTNSRGDHATVPRNHDRVSEFHSLEKRKSPSKIDQRFSYRTADRTSAKRSLDVEGQRIVSSRDGREVSNVREREAVPFDNSVSGDQFHVQIPKNGPGSSSFNRSGHFSGSSSNHPLTPPMRHTSSGLVLCEDDSKVGDHKPNNRYRRNADPNIARGRGNAWKNAPTWPSPVSNGFVPLHHGPPHSGFGAAVQFPPPLYGVRPPMDMNHSGASYHAHEAPNRFSGHIRPVGWLNPINDCPPHMQLWDGCAGVFGEETHFYGRAEWDMHKHLIGGRGWEMRADMWKGKNGNMDTDAAISQEPEHAIHSFPDESWSGKAGHKERAQSEQPFADNSEIKGLNEKSPAKVINTQIFIYEKAPESAKTTVVPQAIEASSYNDVYICCNYLSKLDISLDLASSELFNQCVPLLGPGNNANVFSAVKPEQPKDNKKGATVTSKGRNHILSSIFHTKTDGVFQRAMSLYKKQSEGRKATSICLQARASPEVSEAEKLNGIDNPMRSIDVILPEKPKSASNQVSADGSLVNADTDSLMDEGRKMTDIAFNYPCDCEEQQFDSNSGDVHLIEGSYSCETLLPECRENLSRILLSPGSTH